MVDQHDGTEDWGPFKTTLSIEIVFDYLIPFYPKFEPFGEVFSIFVASDLLLPCLALLGVPLVLFFFICWYCLVEGADVWPVPRLLHVLPYMRVLIITLEYLILLSHLLLNPLMFFCFLIHENRTITLLFFFFWLLLTTTFFFLFGKVYSKAYSASGGWVES